MHLFVDWFRIVSPEHIFLRGVTMKKVFFDRNTIWIYIFIILLFLIVPILGNRAIFVLSEGRHPYHKVIIDAGHGGVDGGAVSCTGVYESQINLEIARKLNDLMHLLGIRTVMIRDTDRSVYTEGETIAAKKVSDIRERIRIVNTTPNAILLSIHQNNFHDARYSGAQVFHNSHASSEDLAKELQEAFRQNLDPSNKRQVKKTSGVYLMEHIQCTGILVECGFLSNHREEAMLRDSDYQNKISCIIAATVSQYLNT